MPKPSDFLPQPPWEGPPLPSFLLKGVEYTELPYQLEVDTSRGVLYLHNPRTGQSVLRICRIPDDLIRVFGRDFGTVIIDLKETPVRIGGNVRGRTIKIEPAFLYVDPSNFTIEDGGMHLEVNNVPESLIKDLQAGRFVDITLGFTGR